MKLSLYIIITGILIIGCNKQNDQQKPAESESTQEIILLPPSSNQNGSIKGIFRGCGYDHTTSQDYVTLYPPGARELDQINSILKFSGLSSNFEIYRADVDNAQAVLLDNRRLVLYNPNFLSYTDSHSGAYWSSMSILAHEIGHHLSGHTLTKVGSHPSIELEADKFSGFILYKLGATLHQSTAAIQSLSGDFGSKTHPAKLDRIRAITKGWNEANETRYNGAIPPPPNDEPMFFDEYTVNMLINKEHLQHESASYFYSEYQFIYGIITEVSKDLSSIKVHVTQTGPEFSNSFRSIDGEDWTVYIDQNSWSNENEMTHVASMNFPSLIVPGRRLKFSMVESYPGSGTATNGVWFLTYAKAMEASAF